MFRLLRNSTKIDTQKYAARIGHHQGRNKDIPKMPPIDRGYERTFTTGDVAPYGYNAYQDFDPRYRPWRVNYDGDGMFLAFFGLATFCLIMYERDYLDVTGRTERDPNQKYYYK